jgi:endoplasmic reticulum junction formation protein lunapark
VSALVFNSLHECTDAFVVFYSHVGLYNCGTLVSAMQKVRPVTSITFSHRISCTEKTLKALLRQQRTKIEEIKKKTNYYTTRNLLERYDESPSGVGGGGAAAASDPNSALRRRMPGGPPTTPQRQGQPSNPNPQTPVSKVPTHQQQLSISSTLQTQLAGMTIKL